MAFTLYESTDLNVWAPRSIPDLEIDSVDLGNGMEQITVRSSMPMTGPDKVTQSFLRLDVE